MCVVIAGDANVGKTLIIQSFDKNVHTKHQSSYTVKWTEGDRMYAYTLWENTRNSIPYRGSPLILVFSVDDISSYHSIKSYWLPRFSEEVTKKLYILVGNKCDIRKKNPNGCVSTEMGVNLMNEIEAKIYIETSAITSENIHFIFSVMAHGLITSSAPMSVIPFSDYSRPQKEEKDKEEEENEEYDENQMIVANNYNNLPLLQVCYPSIYSYSNPFYSPYGFFYTYIPQ